MAARKKGTTKNGKKKFTFLLRMKKKMFVLFFIIVGALIVLVGRLAYIELKSGDRYEKAVLNQQEYSSRTIPFRRGDIVDRKGTVLATSTDVYNVILDCSVLTSKESYVQPTIAMLSKVFGVKESELQTYVQEHKTAKYYVLKKKVSYEKMLSFEKLKKEDQENRKKQNKANNTKNATDVIKGVWFEKEYIRNYPYKTLASSLLGFTTSGNEGIGGIEDYYNSTLNGVDGREYGYVNEDSDYEITVKDAEDGKNIVSTIDINLQSIVEKKIAAFEKKMRNNYKKGKGAKNIGVIMMDPNNGEVLAMANYPNFDLSDPWDLSAYYSESQIEKMSEKKKLKALNAIWQNYCVSSTYEPGSTAKPFTVATGLDTGTLTGNETFNCDGGETINGHHISCIKRDGHGVETLKGALEDSCNDSLMQMSYKIGAKNFSRYQQIFNFGLKTNIDLPGEARTDSLIYPVDKLSKINLAVNSFGQSYNVTMIQMISAYASLINGGTYYQPHVVGKVEDQKGNTIENIEGTVLKKTVSEETSATLRDYLKGVVDEGSGKKAKVDGYSMCGKTGTAQKLPRKDRKYLVSFIGSVPADNPKVAIYVVVNEANSEDQAHSYYAQSIAREILKEALPYLNIYPDEKKTGVNKDIGITGEQE